MPLPPLALALAAALIGASAVAAQDVAPPAAVLDASAPAEAAPDPVARWEADPTVVLDGAEVDLAAFEYVARAFVIFADSPRQPQLAEQRRLLEADPGALAARDVVVIVDSDPEARSALRRELRPRGFGVVLVDKDGRVALRRPAPLSVRDVARAIDRTPLRQEELREGRAAE